AGDWLGEGKLSPGQHVLLMEIKTVTALVGLPGDCWLNWIPDPERKIDLAGTWAAGDDVFTAPKQVTLPGHYHARMMKRPLTIPPDAKGKTAVLSIVSDRAFGAIVNGTLLQFAGGPTKGGIQLNITPYLHSGDNDLEIVSHYGEGEIWDVSVGLYAPESGYP
ncbi:MAG TPA: hypothetical protein VKU80_06205, partial [Planctomycetota bacterium]|nr:hypothetical protein [Planctomycetota bacterium]